MPAGRPSLILLCLLTLCCSEPPSRAKATPNVVSEPPLWASVSPEQIAEAKKHGVPVAFENDLGMRFVLIPAGTFLMGSPKDEEGRVDGEVQHEVWISQPFYMQTTETTNWQYRAWRPKHESLPCDLGLFDTDTQPVVEVAWRGAVDFAKWLSTSGGSTYRLPTEPEWEWACRAGAPSIYFWGVSPNHAYLYVNGLEEATRLALGESCDMIGFPRDDGHRLSAPVGEPRRPNAWGLYDMLGNVSEWCADRYGPYQVRSPAQNPSGPSDGGARVVRGGSWLSHRRCVRSAYRSGARPDTECVHIGFRLVVPLAGKRVTRTVGTRSHYR